MAQSYGQYCPLALSLELLCGRWTLLVISRLLDGCTRFNEIHRGIPSISPSLLSQRLKELESAGLVIAARAARAESAESAERATKGARGATYTLTQAGKELEPVIDHLAVWGHRWARDMELDDLDPAFLVWSMHLSMVTDSMPPGRTVLEFEFSNTPADLDRFWLVNEEGTVEMCLKDPGFDVDLLVRSDLRLFVEAWRGFRDLRAEIAARRIRLLGPEDLRAQFPDWLGLSLFAPQARLQPGVENRLARRCSPSSPADATAE